MTAVSQKPGIFAHPGEQQEPAVTETHVPNWGRWREFRDQRMAKATKGVTFGADPFIGGSRARDDDDLITTPITSEVNMQGVTVEDSALILLMNTSLARTESMLNMVSRGVELGRAIRIDPRSKDIELLVGGIGNLQRAMSTATMKCWAYNHLPPVRTPMGFPDVSAGIVIQHEDHEYTIAFPIIRYDVFDKTVYASPLASGGANEHWIVEHPPRHDMDLEEEAYEDELDALEEEDFRRELDQYLDGKGLQRDADPVTSGAFGADAYAPTATPQSQESRRAIMEPWWDVNGMTVSTLIPGLSMTAYLKDARRHAILTAQEQGAVTSRDIELFWYNAFGDDFAGTRHFGTAGLCLRHRGTGQLSVRVLDGIDPDDEDWG